MAHTARIEPTWKDLRGWGWNFLREGGKTRGAHLGQAASHAKVNGAASRKRGAGGRPVLWGSVHNGRLYCARIPDREIHFPLSDIGDRIKRAGALRRTLGTSGEREFNPCSAPALSSGIEWIYQGKPNRRPAKKGVEFHAHRRRADEYLASERRMREWSGIVSSTMDEIRTIAQEPMSLSHERDLRSVDLLMLPLKDLDMGIDLRILELASSSRVIANEYETISPIKKNCIA